MDERLRLIAEMRDNASPGVRRLKKELDQVKRTPNMEAATKWFGELNKVSSEFSRGGAVASGVLGNIGVGSITAAASLAGLVKSFKDLADQTTSLKEIGRQTGLTADEVNQLQIAGQKLHIDPSRMTAGLQVMADKMFDFRRHFGELYGQLNQFDPDFAHKLSLEKPEEQIKDIVGWLGKIQDPQLQKRWTEAFLGDGSLSRLLTHDGRDFANALADAQAHAAKITPDLEAQAEALYQSTLQFNQAWRDFEISVGPAVFNELKQAADDFRSVFDDIKGAITWVQQHKDHLVSDALKGADDAEAAKAKEAGERYKGQAPWGIGVPKTFTDDLGLTDPKKPWSPDSPYWFNFHDTTPAPQPSPQADLKAMVEERDELRAKVEANRSLETPDALAKGNERDLARIKELEAQIAARDAVKPNPFGALKHPEFSAPQTPDWAKGLLHKSAFVEDEDGTEQHWNKGIIQASAPEGEHPVIPGGTRDFVAIIGAGTKLGFLAAFRELMGENSAEDAAGGGVIKASYETGGSGRGASPGDGFGFRGGGESGSGGQGSGGPDPHGQTKWPEHAEPSDKVALAKESYDFWRSKGLSDAQAAGMVSQEEGESGFDIHNIGDRGTAHDAFQWHADRRAQILRGTGIDVDTAGHRKQLEAAYWEMQHTHKNAWNALRAAKTIQDAVAAGVSKFEVSGNQPSDIAKRTPMAERWSHRFANQPSGMPEQPVAQAPAGAPDWMTDRSKRELAGINKELGQDLLAASEKTGIHFQIAQGLRNQAEAERNALTGRGVRNSQHLYGAAADLHMLDAQGRETYDRSLYQRFGKAYEEISRQHGGHGRWLGSVGGRWGSDIVHFDEGLGYGQTHKRDPFGVGGPTADDVRQGNEDAYRSPRNPFGQKPALEDRQDRARPNIIDEAHKADPQRVHHTGGAVIDIRGLPPSRGTSIRTSGMITAVNLQRAPTFASPSEVG